ncbi:MAG: DUF2148 domain-containing protein [Dehalococcoidia bacterium]|nr:DUF2148 domain-containing protein [Dehalococcoidia bacterium]
MIYTSEETEKKAAIIAAKMMLAAARTAPKACGVDLVETILVDGDDKDNLTATMRAMGTENKTFFIRDAGNIDACHCVVLIGTNVWPRGLNCGLCGAGNCVSAESSGISCAMSVNDLGIAVGSAAATAMDYRMDNRIMFSVGMAALKLKLFSDKVKVCFGIGLATTGKNVFFDRPTFKCPS